MSQNLPQGEMLTCARCSYEWMPRKDGLPKRCPKCRSIKWNDPSLKVTCQRCGHSWNSHNGTPKRCPSCGTHQWNVPPRVFTCKRCNYTWNAKGSKVPRKCPSCSSKDWAVGRDEDTRRASKHDSEIDEATEGVVVREYRRGSSCVDISIAHGIPYSLVYDIVRRHIANINIKV